MDIIKNATFFTIMLHFLLSVIIIGGISKYFIVKIKNFYKKILIKKVYLKKAYQTLHPICLFHFTYFL